MLPEILRTHEQTLRTEVLSSLLEDRLYSPDQRPNTVASLDSFAQYVQKSGIFHSLIASNWNSNDNEEMTESDLNQLGLQVFNGDSPISLNLFGDIQFRLDSESGIVLYDRSTGVGRCMSFATAGSNSLDRIMKNSVKQLLKDGAMQDDDIVITQLQGPLVSWKRTREVKNKTVGSDLIKKIYWPFVLTDLACLWALMNGRDKIFMISADQSIYFYPHKDPVIDPERSRHFYPFTHFYLDSEKNKYKKGVMRYDDTAKGSGFKNDPNTELWVRDLSQFQVPSLQVPTVVPSGSKKIITTI